jgi:hypothetical protein
MDTNLLTVLIPALIAVESSNLPRPKDGDNGAAVGPLQIHAAVVADVNRILGKPEGWYRLEDRRSRTHSTMMCCVYLLHYGDRYMRKHKTYPTLEVYARMWNGGPDGYKKAATRAYWRKVQNHLPRK